MRKFIFPLLLIAPPAMAQTVSPVDQEIADKFRLASVAGDTEALGALLSEKVVVSVTQQMGPDGPNREEPQGSGKAAALEQFSAVIAKTGKPSGAECGAPDGVSIYCQYQFLQGGRGMQSMIMFDGKKIGALMIKYGGIGL